MLIKKTNHIVYYLIHVSILKIRVVFIIFFCKIHFYILLNINIFHSDDNRIALGRVISVSTLLRLFKIIFIIISLKKLNERDKVRRV